MQGDVHPRALGLILLHEVGVDASQDGLMSYNENVFASFQLHNYGLEANNHIAVRFTSSVAVIVFVFVTCSKVVRKSILDFLIGQSVADARVKFVQSFPL